MIFEKNAQTEMCTLETIPEESETELPHVRALIPKSPETIKREIEYNKLCDRYLDDQNLKLYYAMLVTNKNFRKLCASPDMDNCDRDGDKKWCNNVNTAAPTKVATTKCSVATSIPAEDINYFYNGKTDGRKFTAKPLNILNNSGNNRHSNNSHNGSSQMKRNNVHVNKGQCYDANKINEAVANVTAAAAQQQERNEKMSKKRSVSTSIPAEDIRMLCENLVCFNSRNGGGDGAIRIVRE